MEELKKLYEEIQNTWNEMKSMLDRQDKEIKQFGEATQETKNTIDKLNSRIDELEKKMQRVSHKNEDTTKEDGPEVKAFFKMIRKKKDDLTPEEKKALSSLRDPDGGYIAPEEMRNQLITKLRDAVGIRQRATIITTSAQSVGFPTFDYDGNADWTEQSGQIGEENITNLFGKRSFTPHKLARIFRVPAELAEDAQFDIGNFLTNHFATRFGEIEENAFLNGDGVNKPLGILQVKGITEVKSGGTTVASIDGDDLIDVIYSIKAQYRRNGAWMMHRDVVKAIRKLKDSNGQYLWQPGLQPGQPATILSYPLMESECFPTPASSQPAALFGDWKYYWIVDRIDFSVQVLTEKYADYDQVGYKMRKRTDAAPVLTEPFAKLVLKS